MNPVMLVHKNEVILRALTQHLESDACKQAVRTVWGKLPNEVKGVLLPLNIRFYQNSRENLKANGMAQEYEHPGESVYCIWLDESIPRPGLDYVVAHECAHLYLYHPAYKRVRPGATLLWDFMEHQAVWLASEHWGFMAEYQAFCMCD